MAEWKIDRTAAAWGVVFGILATLTGMFLLEAIEGGFLAEGFFLIVISWVIVLVIVAKLFQMIARWTEEDGEEEEE
jgi:membrane associated rhomboid family serine protease